MNQPVDATIIIPTFNRSDALLETLDAVARMDYPAGRWEALVVDDASTDDTAIVVSDRIEKSGARVRYFRQSRNAGPAAARNRGAKEAKGEFLIFIDNDILVEPDFVRSHLDTLTSKAGSWIVGRVVHPPEIRTNPFGRYRDSVWEAFHGSHPDGRVTETSGITAANLSLPAKDFHVLGGFDEDFTIASSEDWDLGMRARLKGIRIFYNPAILVVHNDWALSLDRFCERQKLYSISDVLLWRKYGESSPRARLVRENAPINWTEDRPRLILKKLIKRALAIRVGRTLVRAACSLIERVAPDSKLNRQAYETAVGIAIFRGVREGLNCYGCESSGGKEAPCFPRICHLIDSNIDTNYFRSIAKNFVSYPVMIGSIAPAGTLQQAMQELGTPTFSLGTKSRLAYPLAIFRLVRLLKKEKVTVLHAHCFDPTFVGLIAGRLAGVPFVFTRHHSDHNIRLGARWHTRIDSWCARHADHVIAVSEATRRVMLETEKVPSSQVTVVYNGMEPLREPIPEGVASLKSELHLEANRVVLMLARLHEEKGHRFLFDAIPNIESRIASVKYLLAGDGLHREQLEAEVQARGLQDVVRFLGRRSEVPELISLSDVVVLPSLAESFGFTMLEAMSLGKPVVASTTGGIPEVVVDGQTGMLVAPADSDALANAICEVLQNPGRAKAFGAEGRRRAAGLTFARMLGGYERVYEKVIKQKTKIEYGQELAPSSKRGTIG